MLKGNEPLVIEPRFENLAEKKLLGMLQQMSFVHNTTRELWQRFMPRRKEITNSIGTELFSLEIYKPGFFDSFDPSVEFVKWAAVEVADFDQVPAGMHPLTIPEGLYAVFIHTGPASEGARTYEYIFRTWLPAVPFKVDDRPHFALMGDKYKNNDPESEEEIWIPVKPRGGID